MLLSYKKGLLNTNGFKCFEHNEYRYYYSGIIWMRGRKVGTETIQHISNIFEKDNYIPFIEIFGSFYCIIQKPNNDLIIFTDNSNMHCYYIGQKALSNNYLEAIRNNNANSFNYDAVCEFLAIGSACFGKTLVSDIYLSEAEKYYVVEKGTFKVFDKGIGAIDEKTTINDMNVYFEEMAYSMSDLKVTLSLTGGYDSRLVFACLKKHIPVDVFISGDNKKDMDIVYSQKVAMAGECEIDIIETKKPKITEKYIIDLFEYAQGIAPFLNDGYIRISEFVRNRAQNGYDCYLTGDGGVLHKDWWWIQDLPNYRNKSIDLNKFYSQRINFANENVPWGKKLELKKQLLQENMITEFAKFKMPLNTQTYDSLYFNVNGKKTATNYSIHSSLISSYAPLWERELIKYSYHLPRRRRFFYNSMRIVTTNASKKIARVPTNYGTTASSELVFIMRDIIFQGIDYFKKACRLFGRKFFNVNLFVGNPVTWSAEEDIRKLPIAQNSLDFGINNGFIKDMTKLESISYNLIGRLIQIYMISQYIKEELE